VRPDVSLLPPGATVLRAAVGDARHAWAAEPDRRIFGQGRNVLVAITTNEDLHRLHPAVVRPGRCLAQIEVGPLTAGEASRWLGRQTGSAPLAELYALRDGNVPARNAPTATAQTGQYL
jgi:hypothetical protein